MEWQPTPVFVPGKSQGWRRLEVSGVWGRKEWETTERLSTVHSTTAINTDRNTDASYVLITLNSVNTK